MFTIFLHFKALVENQFKSKIKTLRSNGRGEYTIIILSPFVWIMAFNINCLVLTPLNKMVLLRGNTNKLLRVTFLCSISLGFHPPIGVMLLALPHIWSIEFHLMFFSLNLLGKSCFTLHLLYIPWKHLDVLVYPFSDHILVISFNLVLLNVFSWDTLH